jgi:8-amino-7-oxononanoate synthase
MSKSSGSGGEGQMDKRSVVQALRRAMPMLRGPVVGEKPLFEAQDFSRHSLYSAINKYRLVGKTVGVRDPFFRTHDARSGATTIMNGREVMNYASYDYVGLNQAPEVAAAAVAAIAQYGTSVSASRLVAGERELHGELEREIATHYETEAALTFVSGHATNVATIGVLMTPDDLVIHDDYVHNSALVGIKLSGAKQVSFPHNNYEALEKLLAEHRGTFKNALLVVEGLYSMDGDFPDLPKLIALKEKYGLWLMVDEAHSLGVLGATGRGVFEHFNVDPSHVDIWMGTLSKTLASCGGYIAGSQALIDILKFKAPGFVYSVGLSAPLAAASLAALRLLNKEPDRVRRLQENGARFVKEAKAIGLDTGESAGYSVVPVMVGDGLKAVRLTERLLERGVNALPIMYPAVPLKAARVRFFITSEHTEEQICQTVLIVKYELDRLNRASLLKVVDGAISRLSAATERAPPSGSKS